MASIHYTGLVCRPCDAEFGSQCRRPPQTQTGHCVALHAGGDQIPAAAGAADVAELLPLTASSARDPHAKASGSSAAGEADSLPAAHRRGQQDSGGGQERHVARLEGAEGAPWSVFLLPEGIGKIVHDPYSNSYAAHCLGRDHGPHCRINRVCRKRPVGYLVAWLLDEERHRTASEHKAARLDRSESSSVSYEKRVAARSWFSTLEGSNVVLAREPAIRADGVEEPLRL